MSHEEAPINNQENRVWELRDAITFKLKTKGANPTARLQRMGFEMVRVASNEFSGGSSSLILHVNGEWSKKSGMGGYSIRNATIPELLEEYAAIEDSTFSDLQLRGVGDRSRKSLSDDERDEYYRKKKEEEKKYIEDNKPRLLQGFIESLERTLQEF